MNEQHSF